MKKAIIAAILVMAGLLAFAPVTQAQPVIWGVRLAPPPPPVPLAVGFGPVFIQLNPGVWYPPPPPRYRRWAPPPPQRYRTKYWAPRPWR